MPKDRAGKAAAVSRAGTIFHPCTFYAIKPVTMGKDSVDKTQQEILEEMAKALGHSGDLLEGVLFRLEELGKKMEGIEDIESYNRMVDQFNDLRKEAVLRRDMLMVHREALGIRKHRYLDAYYPIPGKKRKKTADG